MHYILTETHYNHGIKGMLIDREQYVKCPYNDRALYEILGDDSDYEYSLTVEKEGKEPVKYLMRHALQLRETIDAFYLDRFISDIFSRLKIKGNITINLPNIKFIFILNKNDSATQPQ